MKKLVMGKGKEKNIMYMVALYISYILSSPLRVEYANGKTT